VIPPWSERRRGSLEHDGIECDQTESVNGFQDVCSVLSDEQVFQTEAEPGAIDRAQALQSYQFA